MIIIFVQTMIRIVSKVQIYNPKVTTHYISKQTEQLKLSNNSMLSLSMFFNSDKNLVTAGDQTSD